MDQSLNSILNRMEVNFYSLLVSYVSKVRGAQFTAGPVAKGTSQAPLVDELASFSAQETRSGSRRKWWTSLSQALVSLVIWMVLGFAAGYLIGMILPG